MRTANDNITEFLVRNNRTTADSFITDSTLDMWHDNAHKWAAAYYKWPFTENITELGTFGTERLPYSGARDTNIKADSIRMLAVGDIADIAGLTAFKRVTFREYTQYRQFTVAGVDAIFTDYGRIAYVNINASGASGSVYAFYQFLPATLGAGTGTTVFTDYDDEGNEGVVRMMTAYLKNREHLTSEAEYHEKKAVEKLDEVWKRVQDEQATYQAAPGSQGMWQRFDVVRGRGLQPSENSPNQFIF